MPAVQSGAHVEVEVGVGNDVSLRRLLSVDRGTHAVVVGAAVAPSVAGGNCQHVNRLN